jgi:hypothetical protein
MGVVCYLIIVTILQVPKSLGLCAYQHLQSETTYRILLHISEKKRFDMSFKLTSVFLILNSSKQLKF